MAGSNVSRQNAIFIAGLTHSGSTLLDFMLGSQDRLIGLGEVAPLLNPDSAKLYEGDRQCSCGSLLADCPYWGALLRSLKKRELHSWPERYHRAYEVFFEVFGSDAIPVDSSKSLRSLRLVAEMKDLHLHVVHLIRDVRGWTVSHLDIEQRSSNNTLRARYRREGRRAWRSFLLSGAAGRFLVWYHGNRRITKYLQENGIDTCCISYEELVLDTARATDRLHRFANGGGTTSESIESSKSHIALGNRIRLQPERREIRYDPRWLYRSDWMLPAAIFPHIMKYNSEVTYVGLRPDYAARIQPEGAAAKSSSFAR